MYNLTDLRYQSKRRSPQELLQQLSVGIWYFSPGGGRFHERYTPELSIPERMELAAEMAKYGVQGIEAHFPSEVNEENLHLYKKLEQEFGSLSNPERRIREAFGRGSTASPARSGPCTTKCGTGSRGRWRNAWTRCPASASVLRDAVPSSQTQGFDCHA